MIAIATETVREIVRRRFALAAAIATILMAVVSAWGFDHLRHLHSAGKPLPMMEVRAISALLLIMIVYLFSFVLAFGAALLASPTLSAEVDSGVLLPVLARALSRWEIVAGKAAGLAFVLCIFAAGASAIEFGIVRLTTGYAPPHPVAAIVALCALALVVLAFTLAIAARLPMIASSIVAVIAFGVAWMAGIVSSFYPLYHNEALLRIGTISELVMPTDAMWRIAVYQLEPALMQAGGGAQGGWKGPFWVIAPPPPAMEVWCALWILAVLSLAAWSFSTRDI